MVKTILIVAGVGLAALLSYAATQPDTFTVQRSASIKTSSNKLHALINDLHQFNTWNPYNLKDPNIKGFYRGPVSGPGAHYDFEGNKDVGKGSIEITASAADKVSMRLDMIEPFEGHNQVEFRLAPSAEGTQVTWAMQGAAPFMYKLVGLFIDMDHMIGRDFETGLANLKTKAEPTP
ncbi:SRPBCC family protein [Aquabacterium sp.]|uniref:SRPBCC family protein n=1 Tax=Aquabacterium sp. TaxID=1872578 RepID=UPI003D6D327B